MPPTDERFDVFLSYGRGDDDPDFDDTEKSFIHRLYNSLTAAGLKVWWDRENLASRGVGFDEEIRLAVVTRCDKLILVVGAHSVASPYVRDEWERAIEHCLPVIPILRNGDFSLIPKEIGSLNAPDFTDLSKYDNRLRDLIRILKDNPAPGKPHGIPKLPDWYIERGEDFNVVANALCDDTAGTVTITSKKQIAMLHGMGGIGKTTLASALAEDCDVRRFFPDGVFWVEIGKTPEIATRLGDIGTALGDTRDEYPDEQRGKSRLGALMSSKAALIILDDVWDRKHAEPFCVVGQRCRILITTRIERLHTQLGGVNCMLDVLSEDQGLALIAARLNLPHPPTPSPKTGEGEKFGFSPEIETALRAILRLLGGHTQAIAIAAGILVENNLDFAPRLLERMQKLHEGDKPFKDLVLDEDDKNDNLELAQKVGEDLESQIAIGVLYQNKNSIPFMNRQANRTEVKTELVNEVQPGPAQELFDHFR